MVLVNIYNKFISKNFKALLLLHYILLLLGWVHLKYRHTLFYRASLYYTSQVLCFLQTEDKALCQQQYYGSLHYYTCFRMVVWNKSSVSLRNACVEFIVLSYNLLIDTFQAMSPRGNKYLWIIPQEKECTNTLRFKEDTYKYNLAGLVIKTNT